MSLLEVKNLSRTCVACPSQWEAWTADGREIYIRYRWGHLTVDIDGPQGTEIFAKQVGDDMDGYMEDWQMLKTTSIALLDTE